MEPLDTLDYALGALQEVIVGLDATELDAATQKQLDRGARLVELLKQPQFKPMPVEQEVIAIYAATQGYIDDVPVNRVQEFQNGLLQYIDTSARQVRDDLASKKELSAEIEAALKQAIADYKAKAWQK